MPRWCLLKQVARPTLIKLAYTQMQCIIYMLLPERRRGSLGIICFRYFADLGYLRALVPRVEGRGFGFPVGSSQRLKNWHLLLPCLALKF